MARYNRINLDGKSVTENKLVAASTLPGSVVFISSGKFAKYATAGTRNNKLYVLGVDYTQGKKITDALAIDDLGIADYAETGRELAVLVDAAVVLVKDSPLTTTATGTLKLGVVGTDVIVAHSQEALTVPAGGAHVRVRFA